MISKKSVEAKYRRSGILPKKTWLWVDMPEHERHEAQKHVQLLADESFIISYYKSGEYILFLTTQRIITIKSNKIDSYSYTSIKDVKLEEIFSGEKSKQENDVINVCLNSGEVVDIMVEVGTWHALYSILKLVISQSDKIGL
jgi:hypothetical protein